MTEHPLLWFASLLSGKWIPHHCCSHRTRILHFWHLVSVLPRLQVLEHSAYAEEEQVLSSRQGNIMEHLFFLKRPTRKAFKTVFFLYILFDNKDKDCKIVLTKKNNPPTFLYTSEILMGALQRFSCTAVVLANTWRNEMRKVKTAGDD